ncbi:hypothetical protein HPB51_001613 [Rhipicephalus microplus]|uniref:SCP domain-containing protein n=1 Tax=Rhipicephalus microplus TaxID=6941 RepID=A0A9J6EPZ3_RHIMP|nr:hypothetical protein HPB51_001613 [Rhipicephalus microplus]
MHRRSRTYGENIYQGYYDDNHPIRGRDAVDTWYNEINLYDFNKNHRQRGTREFTQMIWKKTSALGTGIARGKNRTYFLVTVYDPRGCSGCVELEQVVPVLYGTVVRSSGVLGDAEVV